MDEQLSVTFVLGGDLPETCRVSMWGYKAEFELPEDSRDIPLMIAKALRVIEQRCMEDMLLRERD